MSILGRKDKATHTEEISTSNKKSDSVMEQLLPEWYKTYQHICDQPIEPATLTVSPKMLPLEVRDSLKEYVKEVMPEPSPTFKIYQELNRDDFDMHKIGNLIGSDPLLAAKVLRIVNSPAYGFTQEITSYGRAVTLMGFKSIRSMVLAQTVKESFSGSKEEQQHAETIRSHSAMVSAIAHNICDSSKVVDPNEATTLALLHDIGKILVPRLKSFGKRFHVSDSMPAPVFEAIIASVFAELWELPNSLIMALEHLPYPLYYTKDQLLDTQIELITVVQAANYIANAIGTGDGTIPLRPLGKEYLEAASLSESPDQWIPPSMVSNIEKSLSALM